MAAYDSDSGESVSSLEVSGSEGEGLVLPRCVSAEPGEYWRTGGQKPKLLAATPPDSPRKRSENSSGQTSPRNNVIAAEDNETNPKIQNADTTPGPESFGGRKGANRPAGGPGPRQRELGKGPSSNSILLGISESNEAVELPTVLPINVGGYRFMTRQSTLCKYGDSMLAAMFSGRHKLDKDRQGYYFIDSNGAYFGYILEFLRHETLPPGDVAVNVYKEACYYSITPLVERLQTSPSVSKTIVREAHRAQFPDYYGLKQKVVRSAMDNAVMTQIGEVIIYAFQKVFTPRAPYFNTQHDCVSDAAHICVGPWDSPADEEMLIRCLENDLLTDGFHIKPHEQRRRCKYYNGQNCQKSIYKITIYFA